MITLSEYEKQELADDLVTLLMEGQWVMISTLPSLFKSQVSKDLSKYQKGQKLRPFLEKNFGDILSFRMTKGTQSEVSLKTGKTSRPTSAGTSLSASLASRLGATSPAPSSSSAANTDARAALTRKLMVVGVSKEEEAKKARLKLKWATRRRAKEWF